MFYIKKETLPSHCHTNSLQTNTQSLTEAVIDHGFRMCKLSQCIKPCGAIKHEY